MLRTDIAEMYFDEKESILFMRVLENSEMTMSNTRLHYKCIEKITNNKKYLALIDSRFYFKADAATLKYTAKKSTFKNMVATVHYNLPIANKLTVNFFNTNLKPPLEFKIFNTLEEGVEWWKTAKTMLL